MGIVARQSIKGTLVSFVGVAIGYINTLWLFPYFLELEQYGLTTVLLSTSVLFISFAQLGTTTIVVKHSPYFKEMPGGHKSILYFIICYPLLSFAFFTGIALLFRQPFIELFQGNSPLFVEFFYLLIPLAFLLMFYQIFSAYSASHLRIVVPRFIKEVLVRIFLGSLILLYGWQLLSFNDFIYLFVGIHGLALILLVMYLIILGQFPLKPNFSFLKQRVLLKKMIVFGWYMVASQTAGMIVTRVDVIMLGAMTGLEGTGIYAVGMYIATMIEIPKRSIVKIADPLVAQAFKNQDNEQIKYLYRSVSLNQILAGGLLLAGVWANIDNLFELIPKREIYVQGIHVVLILGLSKLITMACGISSEVISNSKYFKFNLVTVIILAALTVSTNLILIPLYGINGAALATMLSMLLFNVIKIVFIRIRFGILPFTYRTIKALLVLTVIYLIGHFLPRFDNVFIDLVIRSLLMFSVFVALVLKWNVSQEINDFVKKYIPAICN